MASDQNDDARENAEPTVTADAFDGLTVTCSVETVMQLSRRSSLARRGGAEASGDDARYEQQEEIGRGGMGTVHRAFDKVLLRSVAMKLIESAESGSDAGLRFVEEAQITGQLDHPNIVPVYEFGRLADDRAYFTMKLVSGKTLSEVISELHVGGFQSEALERVLRYLLKVCEAVSFAHSRGVIHRDLKPPNIMIGSHGQVYVMDWGLGLLRAGQRASGAGDAAPKAVVEAVQTSGSSAHTGLEGTVPYMAPEQASGRQSAVDERTDVFALGAVLYSVMTARPPYQAKSLIQALALATEAAVEPPDTVVTHALPPGLCEIAMKAMRRDPTARYQSVDALHAALEDFLHGGGWFATRRYAAGDLIIREGDPANAAYVIVEGSCEAFREEGGKRTRLRELAPGDVFGEAALLNDERRTASVAASGEVVVKVVTRAAFERELGQSAWLGALVRQLAARFLELERRGQPPG